MSKYAIDFGHGVGQDRGASGFIYEETIINAVGSFLVNKLRSLGHEVIEVRPTSASSVSDSLYQRTTKADANNVDLFVSLHANAGGGVGTEVFTYGAKEVPEARAVLNNIVALGFTNRGIKDGSNLYVVKHPSATSMLIEVCFVDTQSDVDKYNSVGSEAIANAIVSGLTGQTVSTTSKFGWIQNSTGWWYRNTDGSYPKDCWLKLDAWYSFDSQGYARCSAWIQDQGKWYWLKSDCRMACNETLHINGKEYSFNDKGEMI